jgi:hypothetical protein
MCSFITAEKFMNYVLRFQSEDFYHSINDVEVLSGACLLIRSATIESIGLFNEKLILNCEDVEWSIRARKKGYRIVYYPEAEVVHLGQQSRNYSPTPSRKKEIKSFCNYFDIYYIFPIPVFFKFVLFLNVFLTLIIRMILFFIKPDKKNNLYK